MTIFFQHVGEKGGGRDFPRTIGTPERGLRQFRFDDVAPYLQHLTDSENLELHTATAELTSGFQIWGIPSGARSVLRTLKIGDYLLLLESIGPGGVFAYAGRIVARPSRECFDLSQHLWGEQRFPLIVFMVGALTNYSWYAFCDSFSYSRQWNPAGNTYRLPEDRIARSQYADESSIVAAIGGPSVLPEDQSERPDTILLDDAELDFVDEEGRQRLREHLIRERSARLVSTFKRQLKKFSCLVCGFDFEAVYGELGSRFIEAHHVRPLYDLQPDAIVSLSDLIPICSNCHRMIHRRQPPMTVDELKEAIATSFEQRDGFE